VVVRALESIGVHGLSLKWPNDILHSGRKLGGILLEMTGDVSGECRVVVGVGLNVNMATADGELIGQQWTDLCKVAGVEIERNEVVRALLSELLPLLRDYTSRRFSHYQGEWQALDAFRGSKVKLLSADDVIYGVAGGVTESGALRLLTSTGEQIITGGEVSLREDS
jgi:BirA family biotin operon repressor/biotin-[acetyl-CoA-carboxylase] ligase